MKKFRKSRKGFTMVELMVVIIIMAVLGLAIMPSLMGSSDKAKYSRAWNDLNAIANAFVGYYGREGTIATISAASGAGLVTALGDAKDTLQSFLNTPIDSLKDPWGNEYQIAGNWNETTGKGYIIVFVKPETDDSVTVTFRSGVTCSAKKDPYQSTTENEIGMAKLVIDIPE